MNILLGFFSKNSDTDSVLESMETFTNYSGVSGSITLTEDNKTLFPTAIFELQKGEAIKIQ